ncbi:MAG TPA: hypothetical protein DCK95_03065 [Anaerolineaceae bacterium]|nr:hypothetical protein [Anaerolineaceae bacterium]
MPLMDDISKGLKKGVEGAEKGLKQVGEKASDTVKTYEIQQEIDKLESDIEILKMEIGDKAVELIAKGNTLDPEIDELVIKIEGIKAKIVGKQVKIEEIKND